jgi:hypothetical protein
VIYVYAIAEAGAPPGGQLQATTHGAIAGIYSTEAPAATSDGLWQHARVLEELMADRAVLPLRFGSTLAGVAALYALLREREEEFTRTLAFVSGGVEVSVHARLDDPPCARRSRRSGRDYLAAKLERRRSAARLAEELNAELAPFARASSFRTVAAPHPELAGAYLVDRDRLDAFLGRARELDARRPEAELACSGPWPPFSFTEPLEARDG